MVVIALEPKSMLGLVLGVNVLSGKRGKLPYPAG